MYIWGRVGPRVGSDFLSAIAGRVGSMFRRVGLGPRKVTRGQLRANPLFYPARQVRLGGSLCRDKCQLPMWTGCLPL